MAILELLKTASTVKVPSFVTLIGLLLLAILLYVALSAFYNLYLHPLRDVPGPKSWIAFPTLFHIARMRGIVDAETIRLHNKYGETVRVHPTLVSFTSAQSWRDIYSRESNMPKLHLAEDGSPPGIFTTHDSVAHARLRRVLNPIFSERGIRKLEPIVKPYVDMFLDSIRQSTKAGEEVEFKGLFHRTAFDIIGALAFGESFDGLKTGIIHPWINVIFQMTKIMCFIQFLQEFPPLFKLMLWLMPASAKEQRKDHENFVKEKIRRRLQNESLQGNGDFTDVMFSSKGTKDELSDEELSTNAGELVFAGSETIATAAMGLVYWLVQTPRALEKATNEVRSAFQFEDEITFNTTIPDTLPYLNACFTEVFRIYSPTQSGVQRIVPKGQTRVIDGIVMPEEIRAVVHHHAAFTIDSHFHDPTKFVPERWLPEATNDPASPFYNDNRATVLPFGLGPRRCIGQTLAMNEVRYIFTRLLWNFDMARLNPACRQWHVQKAYLAWEKGPLMVAMRARSFE